MITIHFTDIKSLIKEISHLILNTPDEQKDSSFYDNLQDKLNLTYQEGINELLKSSEIRSNENHVLITSYHIHGTYNRKLIICGHKFTLTIARIMDLKENTTHAILTTDLSPYSQYSLFELYKLSKSAYANLELIKAYKRRFLEYCTNVLSLGNHCEFEYFIKQLIQLFCIHFRYFLVLVIPTLF